MSLAMQIENEAFGGKNMIFAGDFAQLPPLSLKGPALYNETVSTVLSTTNGYVHQRRTIGKALWHQVTMVVILRKNMRQKTQSPDDARFRKALENMRYKSCTPEDYDLILSRVPGPQNPSVDLGHPDFRYISVITAWNSQRDQINKMGCQKFAQDTGQYLTNFYSVDRMQSANASDKIDGRTLDVRRRKDVVPTALQKKLQDLPHAATGNVPGTLSLCQGMPVLIKRNEVTELCVTNGAEATVIGWRSHVSPHDQETLDTVFIKLTKPPQPVQLDGLPENVVPISRQTTRVKCEMPNDIPTWIAREQVPLLPNFAMTDYASQGRTRPYNVVDLKNCRGHQSIYTCLSRSASITGT
ncbi:hypothetical protein BV25DRAFT_1762200, partial [Artomyces pyxidatus]